MQTNITKLEVKIGEKRYMLLCDIDSPIVDAKEAVFQFQKWIGRIEDYAREQEEKAKAESDSLTPVVEEPKIEPMQA